MRVTFTVTREDLLYGRARNAFECPVVRALNRALNRALQRDNVEVAVAPIGVLHRNECYPISTQLRRYIRQIDAYEAPPLGQARFVGLGYLPPPRRFTITVPLAEFLL